MRICLYTETALPKIGGQELVVDALARQFTALGHETTVLAQKPRRRFTITDEQLPYTVVRHPRFISTRFFVSWYRYFLRRLHVRRPFDIVHAHSVYPCGYLAALCKSELGIKLAITSHGGDVRENNPRFEKSGLRERHETAVAAADSLIAISAFTADGYRRLDADPTRITTIPNGVDLAPLQTKVARPDDLPSAVRPGEYLLFLGRLNRRKGTDLLLEAYAKQTAQRLPLVVAGDGDEAAALKQSVAQLGAAESVYFVGRVEGERKTYLLQNALALVAPSRDWEAFPLVVLEAYACGLPVVATKIPGLRDLIEHCRTGVLVPGESPAALASALDDIAARPDWVREMGERAARRAAQFDWRTIARRHLDLFASLQDSRRSRAA